MARIRYCARIVPGGVINLAKGFAMIGRKNLGGGGGVVFPTCNDSRKGR